MKSGKEIQPLKDEKIKKYDLEVSLNKRTW